MCLWQRRLLWAVVLRTLLFLTLLLAACGNEKDAFLTVFDPCEPLVLEPAPGATEQQLGSVADAVDMWNAVASTQMTLEPAPGAAKLPILFVDSFLYMGFYDDEDSVIRLARRVDQRSAMAVVLAHELGHAFNLHHVGDRTSVMNEGNWEVGPLESDARALEAEWGPCVHR